MNISPLSPASHVPAAVPQAGGDPAPSVPADRFTASEDRPSDGLRAAARVLTQPGKLAKGDAKYRPAAWASGPQGESYVGYREGWSGDRGYLARVEADGRIAWELPLDEARVNHVSVSGDGSRVLVGTANGHVLASSDGRFLGSETARSEVRGHYVDGSGLHLEVMTTDGRARAFTSEDQPMDLPEAARDLNVRSVEPTSDGGLLLAGHDRAVRLGPGGTLVGSVTLPTWKAEGNTSFASHKVWPTDDGGYLVEKHAYTTITPRGPHRFMMRPGFGGNFDPDYYMPETFTRASFVRLDASGQEKWSTEDVGNDNFRPLVLPDGTAWFAGGRADAGQSGLRRLSSDGTVVTAFQVPGNITELRADPSGALLVKHDNQVTRFAPDGRSRGSVTLDGERRSYALEGGAPDGRMIFRDDAGSLLWSCDPGTGRWTRMTDPEVDHSLRADQIADAPAEPPGRVEETEEWVVIGDVQLEKR